ncbi:hypothetical protein [Paracoccus chinensis]|nr:hypothetical protein [Paracoccus chinensis]
MLAGGVIFGIGMGLANACDARPLVLLAGATYARFLCCSVSASGHRPR